MLSNTSEAERFDDVKSKDMAYSNVAPIPLYKEQGQQKYYSDRSSSGQERRLSKGAKEFPPAFERRDAPGRGAGRLNSKPYGIDIAPLNVFENQVIPVGIHNLSKSFRPNMATIRVLSLGTKFIPKWRDPNLKHTFKKIRDFNRRNAK